MNGTAKVVSLWAPPVLWMAVIFLLSSTPKVNLPDYGGFDFAVKKSAHVAEYGLLGFLLLRAYSGGRLPLRRTIGLATGVAFLFAISDEGHQFFVPGREGKPFDVLVDLAGICLGQAGWLVWKRLSNRKAQLER